MSEFLCETCCNNERKMIHVTGYGRFYGRFMVCQQGLAQLRTKCELYNIPVNNKKKEG